MQPGTPHFVFTLEASAVHGSHFYSTATLTKTLNSRWVDRTANASTNAVHISNEIWLHALLSSERTRWFSPPRRSENALLNRPACDDLASLVIMCLYPEVFEPHELANSSGALDTVPGLSASRKTARKSAAMLLEFAKNRCKPANDVPVSEDQLTYLKSFVQEFNSKMVWLQGVCEDYCNSLNTDTN
jgi:hypothetical protein